MSGCEDVRMWGCEDVRMWGCEDVRMWGCEDVRNEATGWMRGRRHTEGKERESQRRMESKGREREGGTYVRTSQELEESWQRGC